MPESKFPRVRVRGLSRLRKEPRSTGSAQRRVAIRAVRRILEPTQATLFPITNRCPHSTPLALRNYSIRNA